MTFKTYVSSLLLLYVTLTGCYSSKIPLSPEEEKLAASIAREYQCEASLQHDYTAIRENKKDGAFLVTLTNTQNNDPCAKDSATLKNISIAIASQVTGVLTYKQHYHSITVSFLTIEKTGPTSDLTLCNKELNISIKDPNNVQITRWRVRKN